MSLLSLPDEILEQIFLTKNGIQASDIIAVTLPCRRFREIIMRIWRPLFTVHFPEIAHQLEDTVHGAPQEFWLSHFTARYKNTFQCTILQYYTVLLF